MDDKAKIYEKTDKQIYIDKEPADTERPGTKKTAIFITETPGAGKSEIANGLKELWSNLVLIDADKFVKKFSENDRSNPEENLRGAAMVLDYTYDYVFKNDYSYILAGTFAIEQGLESINRAVKKGYRVSLYFVYQDPMIAWDFIKKKGWAVPKKQFIQAYFLARENIARTVDRFGAVADTVIIIKDYRNAVSEVIEGVENLELVLPRQYTPEVLEVKLHD